MPDPSLDTQYDVLYILRPELSQEEQEAAIAAFEEVVVANGGEVLATSPWGLRRLSYELDGLREGIYVNMPRYGARLAWRSSTAGCASTAARCTPPHHP